MKMWDLFSVSSANLLQRPNEEVSNNTTNNILIKIWGFDFQKTL
jgi:hypothetical protein